jgi:hypothetical protein
MDDFDGIEDIFEEDDMLLDSQESMTAATANLVFDNLNEEMLDDLLSTPATSQSSQNPDENTCCDMETEKSSKQSDSSPLPGTVLEQIESIFDQITRTLADQTDMLKIRLKVRPKSASFRQSSSSTALLKSRSVSFPGKTATEAWRFSIPTLRFLHQAATDPV